VSELGRAHEGLDVLVVGSGIAGLSVALSLAGQRHLRLAVVSEEVGGGSTFLAQGGIAAALGPGDTAAAHAADTLRAAAGLGEPAVAEAVASGAPEAVELLASFGARFDREALAKEGGHRRARVVHAGGDATGAEISRALVAAARERGVMLLGGWRLVELVGEWGKNVSGAVFAELASGRALRLEASNVVLATGGYAGLYASTTSPPSCTGTGLAAAMRAGAQVADLEFVQFHPTGMALGRDPRPLASEALRGAGARLRDTTGGYLHPATGDGSGDLAPRDIVSRSMATRMAELGASYCWLDATSLGHDVLEERFPTYVAACRSAGLAPERDWAPVSPTAHYTMGGVLTDAEGRTTLEGLLAVGEVASSGLHGANRLASNSLLEGAVIGRRAGAAVLAGGGRPVAPRATATMRDFLGALQGSQGQMAHPLSRWQLREAVEANAGVCRSAERLARLAQLLEAFAGAPGESAAPGEAELASMALVGRAMAQLALRRCESRGAHWRSDYPSPGPGWQVRQVAQLLQDGSLAVGELQVEATAEAVAA
jgi:L-aspartate oxidase